MNHDLSPMQALLIFGILARHGECTQAELIPKVKKSDRDALVRCNLVAVGKAGRGYTLTLSDAGWAWAARHLSAELPPAQRTLSDLLTRLSDHLDKGGITLADFVGTKPNDIHEPRKIRHVRPKSSAKASSRSKPKARPTPRVKQPSAEDIRARIEQAYLKLTQGRKDEAVRLSRLREELSDFDRKTLDAALGRILHGDPTASLLRYDDPRRLEQADRNAAYNPAGEPFHVIWISS